LRHSRAKSTGEAFVCITGARTGHIRPSIPI